jgi:hypothetical protein
MGFNSAFKGLNLRYGARCCTGEALILCVEVAGLYLGEATAYSNRFFRISSAAPRRYDPPPSTALPLPNKSSPINPFSS